MEINNSQNNVNIGNLKSGLKYESIKGKPAAESIFKAADKNGDGVLSEEEIKEYLETGQDGIYSNIVTENNENGEITKYYSEDNVLAKEVIKAEDKTTEILYEADGQTPQKIIENDDNNNTHTETIYQEGKRKTSETVYIDAKGGKLESIEYGDDGHPISKTVELINETEHYEYLENGTERITSKVQNQGHDVLEKQINYNYNEDGSYTETIRQIGLKGFTINTFNADGHKLNSTKNVNGEEYTIKYDGKGNTEGVVIQSRETIEWIAHKFGCSVEELQKLNGKKNFSVGDVIKVPGEKEADMPEFINRKSSEEAIAEEQKFNEEWIRTHSKNQQSVASTANVRAKTRTPKTQSVVKNTQTSRSSNNNIVARYQSGNYDEIIGGIKYKKDKQGHIIGTYVVLQPHEDLHKLMKTFGFTDIKAFERLQSKKGVLKTGDEACIPGYFKPKDPKISGRMDVVKVRNVVNQYESSQKTKSATESDTINVTSRLTGISSSDITIQSRDFTPAYVQAKGKTGSYGGSKQVEFSYYTIAYGILQEMGTVPMNNAEAEYNTVSQMAKEIAILNTKNPKATRVALAKDSGFINIHSNLGLGHRCKVPVTSSSAAAYQKAKKQTPYQTSELAVDDYKNKDIHNRTVHSARSVKVDGKDSGFSVTDEGNFLANNVVNNQKSKTVVNSIADWAHCSFEQASKLLRDNVKTVNDYNNINAYLSRHNIDGQSSLVALIARGESFGSEQNRIDNINRLYNILKTDAIKRGFGADTLNELDAQYKKSLSSLSESSIGQIDQIFNQLLSTDPRKSAVSGSDFIDGTVRSTIDGMRENLLGNVSSEVEDLAKKFYEIVDDESGDTSMTKLSEFLTNNINKDNIVDFMFAYNNLGHSRSDSGVFDSVFSESGASLQNQKNVSNQIFNLLKNAARSQGVPNDMLNNIKLKSYNAQNCQAYADEIIGLMRSSSSGGVLGDLHSANYDRNWADGVADMFGRSYRDMYSNIYKQNTSLIKIGNLASQIALEESNGIDSSKSVDALKNEWKKTFNAEFNINTFKQIQDLEDRLGRCNAADQALSILLPAQDARNISELKSILRRNQQPIGQNNGKNIYLYDSVENSVAELKSKYGSQVDEFELYKLAINIVSDEYQQNKQKALGGANLRDMEYKLKTLNKSLYGTTNLADEVTSYNANQAKIKGYVELGADLVLMAVPGVGAGMILKSARLAELAAKGNKLAKMLIKGAKFMGGNIYKTKQISSEMGAGNMVRTAASNVIKETVNTVVGAGIQGAETFGIHTLVDGQTGYESWQAAEGMMKFAVVGKIAKIMVGQSGGAIAENEAKSLTSRLLGDKKFWEEQGLILTYINGEAVLSGVELDSDENIESNIAAIGLALIGHASQGKGSKGTVKTSKKQANVNTAVDFNKKIEQSKFCKKGNSVDKLGGAKRNSYAKELQELCAEAKTAQQLDILQQYANKYSGSDKNLFNSIIEKRKSELITRAGANKVSSKSMSADKKANAVKEKAKSQSGVSTSEAKSAEQKKTKKDVLYSVDNEERVYLTGEEQVIPVDINSRITVFEQDGNIMLHKFEHKQLSAGSSEVFIEGESHNVNVVEKNSTSGKKTCTVEIDGVQYDVVEGKKTQISESMNLTISKDGKIHLDSTGRLLKIASADYISGVQKFEVGGTDGKIIVSKDNAGRIYAGFEKPVVYSEVPSTPLKTASEGDLALVSGIKNKRFEEALNKFKAESDVVPDEILDLQQTIALVEDKAILDYIDRKLESGINDSSTLYETLMEISSLVDAVNQANQHYIKIKNPESIIDNTNVSNMSKYLHETSGRKDVLNDTEVLSQTLGTSEEGATNVKRDFDNQARFETLTQYLKEYPNSPIADHLYNTQYVEYCKEIGIEPALIDKILSFNAKYNTKIVLSENNLLAKNTKALDFIDAELNKWKVASKGMAKIPSVIDFNKAKTEWWDATTAYGKNSASASADNSSINFSDELYALGSTVRHEITHMNSKRLAVNPEFSNFVQYKEIIVNGEPVEVLDIENSKYAKELLKAGLNEREIEYAYNNQEEFIAVASQGNLSAYSPEFRKVLVDLGMPEWIFNLDGNVAAKPRYTIGEGQSPMKRRVAIDGKQAQARPISGTKNTNILSNVEYDIQTPNGSIKVKYISLDANYFAKIEIGGKTYNIKAGTEAKVSNGVNVKVDKHGRVFVKTEVPSTSKHYSSSEIPGDANSSRKAKGSREVSLGDAELYNETFGLEERTLEAKNQKREEEVYRELFGDNVDDAELYNETFGLEEHTLEAKNQKREEEVYREPFGDNVDDAELYTIEELERVEAARAAREEIKERHQEMDNFEMENEIHSSLDELIESIESKKSKNKAIRGLIDEAVDFGVDLVKDFVESSNLPDEWKEVICDALDKVHDSYDSYSDALSIMDIETLDDFNDYIQDKVESESTDMLKASLKENMRNEKSDNSVTEEEHVAEDNNIDYENDDLPYEEEQQYDEDLYNYDFDISDDF